MTVGNIFAKKYEKTNIIYLFISVTKLQGLLTQVKHKEKLIWNLLKCLFDCSYGPLSISLIELWVW